MSKRLGPTKIRVINSDGVVVIQNAPMTKGQALIRARNILGPKGFVDQVMGEFPCVFVREVNGTVYLAGTGPDWESALAGAAGSVHAVAWSDREVELGNLIEAAKEGYEKAKGISLQETMKKFYQGLVEKWDKRDTEKAKNAENYELWKEERAERLEEMKHRTKLLSAMEPEERLAFLAEEKHVAKELKRQEYKLLAAGGSL